MKRLGRYEEALADYEKCFDIQKPPRITDGLHSRAQLHELMGDYAAPQKNAQLLNRDLFMSGLMPVLNTASY